MKRNRRRFEPKSMNTNGFLNFYHFSFESYNKKSKQQHRKFQLGGEIVLLQIMRECQRCFREKIGLGAI